MKTTQYVRQLKAIEAADSGGIRERWLFGLRLLRDPEVMAPSGKSLRHGITEQLIAAAGANSKGRPRLSDQDIQRCIRCARAYSTEAQIRHAVTDFESWRDIVAAGFPEYEAPEGEPLADHRNDTERGLERDRELEDMFGAQGALFAATDFQPTATPLRDLKKYAEEMEELTGRFVERDRKRRSYLDDLIMAADGDLSVTWLEAQRRRNGGAV